MIGVYTSYKSISRDEGKVTENVIISVAKKDGTVATDATTTTTNKSGARTYWTGPVIKDTGNTATAGGWT